MSGKFILGDCMDTENGIPSYPDNHFDLAIVDPPYGVDFQSSRRIESQRFKKIKNDKQPFIEFITPLKRKLKDGGRAIIFYRWDVAQIFINECKRVGFELVSEIIWDKVIHGMGDLKACIGPQHESAVYITKGRYEFKSKRPKSIYRHVRVLTNSQIHPNEKPINLYKAFLRDFATPGDIILDPFVGSGNSLIACESMGFNYVGYEIDPDYYAAAKNRMSKGIQQLIF
jgi:DNA modification methylase